MIGIYNGKLQFVSGRHERPDHHRQVLIGVIAPGGVAVEPQFEGIGGVLIVEVELYFKDVVGIAGAGLNLYIADGAGPGAGLQVDQRQGYAALVLPFAHRNLPHQVIGGGIARYLQLQRHVIPTEALVEYSVEIDAEEVGIGRPHQVEIEPDDIPAVHRLPQVIDRQALKGTAGAGYGLNGVAHPASAPGQVGGEEGVYAGVVVRHWPYRNRQVGVGIVSLYARPKELETIGSALVIKVDGGEEGAVAVARPQFDGHIAHPARLLHRVHAQVVDAEISGAADEQALHVAAENQLALGRARTVEDHPKGNARGQGVQARGQHILNKNTGAVDGQVDGAAVVVEIHHHAVYRIGISSQVENRVDGFKFEVLARGGRHFRVVGGVEHDQVAVGSGPEQALKGDQQQADIAFVVKRRAGRRAGRAAVNRFCQPFKLHAAARRALLLQDDGFATIRVVILANGKGKLQRVGSRLHAFEQVGQIRLSDEGSLLPFDQDIETGNHREGAQPVEVHFYIVIAIFVTADDFSLQVGDGAGQHGLRTNVVDAELLPADEQALDIACNADGSTFQGAGVAKVDG